MPLPDLTPMATTGAEIEVRVTPRAARARIVQEDGALRVYVTAPPEDGKANAAVQKLLAKSLGVAKTRLTLVGGASSRTKRFRID